MSSNLESTEGLLPETKPGQFFRVYLARRSELSSCRQPAREVDKIIRVLRRHTLVWNPIVLVLPDRLNRTAKTRLTPAQKQFLDARRTGCLVLAVDESEAEAIAERLNSLGDDLERFSEAYRLLDRPWEVEND